MCQEKKMGLDARLEYLWNVKQRYRKAGRSEKTRLLNEMEKVTGLYRKYLIARMNGPGPKLKKRRTRERGRTYGKEVADAVYFVAETLDWIWAERLKPVLCSTAVHLAKFDEM